MPLSALGVVALGGAYYYADAYLSVARPYCTGITPDGCRLNWQQVGFDNGDGGEWQCVQYCARPGQAPPPRTVALVAPPPLPQGGACEISIFSEPNFAGTNATASDEQPNLDEIGWQNQIASVQVQSGTWDFFSDQSSPARRCGSEPGEYADLGPQWAQEGRQLDVRAAVIGRSLFTFIHTPFIPSEAFRQIFGQIAGSPLPRGRSDDSIYNKSAQAADTLRRRAGERPALHCYLPPTTAMP